jgi:hypothetical protein
MLILALILVWLLLILLVVLWHILIWGKRSYFGLSFLVLVYFWAYSSNLFKKSFYIVNGRYKCLLLQLHTRILVRIIQSRTIENIFLLIVIVNSVIGIVIVNSVIGIVIVNTEMGIAYLSIIACWQKIWPRMTSLKALFHSTKIIKIWHLFTNHFLTLWFLLLYQALWLALRNFSHTRYWITDCLRLFYLVSLVCASNHGEWRNISVI